jgi:hypothetical protein
MRSIDDRRAAGAPGDDNEAALWYERTIAAAPDHATIATALAATYSRLG